MATTLPTSTFENAGRLPAWPLGALRQGWATWLPFAAVVALAFAINAWSLNEIGYGNTYYAAAVRSMTESWHNFFFGSFDPGGFVTVDKPPVFLWFDALSARVFGYSSLSLMLPSAVAGAAGVALLWLIVRRHFGVLAATVAGAVLALTPISVAVNRLNLPEPFYILALIAAAGCVMQSLESRRWWAWAIGAGLLVGVAFNTKMLAAWIPGPALALALVIGLKITKETAAQTVLRQWLPRLALFGGVTLAASASWMLVVDNWPAGDRPYIGGSTDNTVQDLILGYNGIGRVEGENMGGGPRPNNAGDGFAPGGQPLPDGGGFNQQRGPAQDGLPAGPGGPQPQGGLPNTRPGQAAQGGAPVQPGGAPNARTGAGGIIAGAPDLFRMFDSANGAQIGWLLPFALMGGVLCLWRWRDDPVRRGAVILWLGWVVLFGGVFSYTQGIYHSYYTAAMAPGIAAMAGISSVGVVDLARRNRAWFIAAAAMIGVTLWAQMVISGRFEDHLYELRPYAIVIAVAGTGILAATLFAKVRLPLATGLVVAIAGLLVIPGAWSGYEAANASMNTTLPQAGPRQGAAGRSFGSEPFDGGVAQLAAWVEANKVEGMTWDLAVSSAMNASTLIARYDLSVLAIGGFNGRDATITAAGFGELVAEGKVRYVLTVSGMGGGAPGGAPAGLNNRPGVQPDGVAAPNAGAAPGVTPAGSSAAGPNAVFAAVQAVCTPVTGSGAPAQYQGSLYDCAGKAEELSKR